MTVSSHVMRTTGLVISMALGAAAAASAETPVLNLRATVMSAVPPATLTLAVNRWSTDAERAPVLAALAAPPPAAAPAAAPEGGAARGGRAGRAGGRGARGGGPPQSPIVRLTAVVKAAPTIGFIWSEGVTGYSIKYAWRSSAGDRIVLVTDRRLGAHAPDWPSVPAAAADAEFTVIEMRVDAKGVGEGKTSLTTSVVVDAAAQTIALDGYQGAPALLRVESRVSR